MKYQLLELLLCPQSGLPLKMDSDSTLVVQDVESGWLVSADGQHRYPIHNGIPRFVPHSNYADNFGMQWNYFRKTQLDSYSGQQISADRFWQATGWQPHQLKNKWVLDVGCGAGRFAEIALKAGAIVVALDYSNAVDACYENLKEYPNLHLVQGDIYALPFMQERFSFVYSLGVLQHTPDVAKAFAALPDMLKSNGELCVDYYEKTWKSALLPKYWLRPLTKRIPRGMLFTILQKIVPGLLQLSRVLGSIPLVGLWLRRIVPILSYYRILPLTPKQHREWALLDTFDMFAPEYDSPQTAATIKSWMQLALMKNIEILKIGHLVARGKK